MSLSRAAAFLFIVGSACASGGQGTSAGDDSSGDDDSLSTDARDDDPLPDTPMDTAPVPATLTQTTSSTPTAANSLVCNITANATTTENSWYRVFRLADAGITGPFMVSGVSFGVSLAEGAPTATIKLGTYTANIATPPSQLDLMQITPLAQATYAAPDVSTSAPITALVPISATVPAGAQLVVEISVPDYSNTKKFWIAGNPDGESKPSWWRAPACMQPQPVTTATANFPMSFIPISVVGEH